MSGLARKALKWPISAADVIWSPPRGVTVLIYHRVGGRSGLEIDLPVDQFEAQVEALAASGRVTTLDSAVQLLQRQQIPETDPIVITFDDGTDDFADQAMPVLDRYQLPVTLYLATQYVDEQRRFPHDGIPISWNALADIHSAGLLTVGAHTHSHALLDRLDSGAVVQELDRSDDLIAHHLGTPPLHFAYPKAVLGSAYALEAVRRRYRSAALAGTRSNVYGKTDLHRLSRSPIQTSDGMRFFVAKTRGGMRLEDRLRVAVNRRRYRDATT